MGLDQVVLCSHHDSIALVVAWEFIVDACQIFSYFYGRVQGLLAIEGPVGCQNEVQLSEVTRKVAVAEIVGEL